MQDVTNGDNGDKRKADKRKADMRPGSKRRREQEEEEVRSRLAMHSHYTVHRIVHRDALCTNV